MVPRLATHIWVSAYLKRLELAGIPAYVTARGDPEAGAVLVKVALMDGMARAWERRSDILTGARAWFLLAEGPETDVDALVGRTRARDPDLWVIELEDRQGRTLLDEEGLSE
ncbi:DUF1491 family protein [Tabrizicola sp. YIM 78059]|uniref:DUF1491 family protein n=1 Tax=Tabrizicola sp. YIM 78059 TaxID=2529861 RepID=UPI0010AA266D|nr:DUF1491 family protein [Tabrizicola sp. YIM 78059]